MFDAEMENVLRYSIPVAHPYVVHFPVVLVLLGAAACLIWLLRDRLTWLKAAIVMEAFGLFGAIAAVLTGEKMKEQSEGVPIVEELVRVHESSAVLATWLTGIALLVMTAALVYGSRDTTRTGVSIWLRLLIAAGSVYAAVQIAWTAHVGGIMVWGVPA